MKLTKRQTIVLDAVLRSLDMGNEYLLGDRVRLAFETENAPNQLQTPGRGYGKDFGGDEDEWFEASGMAPGGHYHVPGERKDFRKIWKNGPEDCRISGRKR